MALDEADKKLIADLIGAALKDAMKPETLGAAVAPVIQAHVKEATKGFVTAEDAKKAAEADKAKGDADKAKGDGKKGADEPNEAMQTLQRKLDEITARADAAEKARADAERKATVDAARSKVRDALAKAGVPADRLHLAMAAVEASGQLTLDGDGAGWKTVDRYGIPKVATFDEGAAEWIKGSDGKVFLPPVDVAGSGDGRRTGNKDGETVSLDALAKVFNPLAHVL